MTTRFLGDDKFDWFEQSDIYKSFDGKCPTCRGTHQFRYRGRVYECPRFLGSCEQNTLFRFYAVARLPYEYMTIEWDGFPHPHAKEAIDEYLANFDNFARMGIGVEIFGSDLGVGKTTAGCHVLREAIRLRGSGYFINFSTLLAMIRLDDSEWQKIVPDLLGSGTLLIDDIKEPNTEKQRDFFEDQLEWVIRHRLGNCLPTITTTNLTQEQMAHHYPRIHSLLSMKQIRIELTGEDIRKGDLGFLSLVDIAMKGEVRPIQPYMTPEDRPDGVEIWDPEYKSIYLQEHSTQNIDDVASEAGYITNGSGYATTDIEYLTPSTGSTDWDVVRQIKYLYQDGMTQKQIAEKFDMAQGTVSRILNGKRRKVPLIES